MSSPAAKRLLGAATRLTAPWGLDLRVLATRLARLPRYRRERRRFAELARRSAHPIPFGDPYPILTDYAQQAGVAAGQYFHQDLWAARKVFARRPARHVDVGSRLDGFVAHLLTFMDVTAVDVRPLDSPVRGLTFVRQDATEMAGFADGSIESLSCLNAVEHFGLGRYGDPLAVDAWADALRAFARVLAPGGRLYLGVPIGRERVAFNAHRVFHARTIVAELRALRLLSFSAVDDADRFVENARLDAFDDAALACGLFEFGKD
ncbi:MAG: DUF268 domain-containing protein [Gemmatimonadota bacterium]|nr:DUF268 domain-containing protein [Gemmatimonadota bacterium]